MKLDFHVSSAFLKVPPVVKFLSLVCCENIPFVQEKPTKSLEIFTLLFFSILATIWLY